MTSLSWLTTGWNSLLGVWGVASGRGIWGEIKKNIISFIIAGVDIGLGLTSNFFRFDSLTYFFRFRLFRFDSCIVDCTLFYCLPCRKKCVT